MTRLSDEELAWVGDVSNPLLYINPPYALSRVDYADLEFQIAKRCFGSRLYSAFCMTWVIVAWAMLVGRE